MRQQRTRVVSIFIMLFFLCLLLCETTYCQYESGSVAQADVHTEAQLKRADKLLSLVEVFQQSQTLNSRTTIAHIERNMPERVRVGAVFYFFILLASFIIEVKKWEQEQSLCLFQTFFQNLLNIIHRRDGKKDAFFCVTIR